MGMSVGMFQSSSDGDFNPAAIGDEKIPTGSVQGSKLDLGGGVYFNTQDMYIGISSTHMNEPIIDWSDGKQYPLKRHYFLISGYYYELNTIICLLYTSPSPRDGLLSRMPSSA